MFTTGTSLLIVVALVVQPVLGTMGCVRTTCKCAAPQVTEAACHVGGSHRCGMPCCSTAKKPQPPRSTPIKSEAPKATLKAFVGPPVERIERCVYSPPSFAIAQGFTLQALHVRLQT